MAHSRFWWSPRLSTIASPRAIYDMVPYLPLGAVSYTCRQIPAAPIDVPTTSGVIFCNIQHTMLQPSRPSQILEETHVSRVVWLAWRIKLINMEIWDINYTIFILNTYLYNDCLSWSSEFSLSNDCAVIISVKC